MIIVFDLDDTLYEESTYVRSGFVAVAEWVAARYPITSADALAALEHSLRVSGRGRNFDDLAQRLGDTRKSVVRVLVNVYRAHEPAISPDVEAIALLDKLKHRTLYLVTDGHKLVQERKLRALGIADRFRHCYLTNRYGIRHQKPSSHVFRLIARREDVCPDEIVYVADNPAKDFRGIRPLGFRTVRVLRGAHRHVVVAPAMDAEVTVDRLSQVPAALVAMERRIACKS